MILVLPQPYLIENQNFKEYEFSMTEHFHFSFALYLEIVDDLDVGFETIIFGYFCLGLAPSRALPT
jgi:hypothetical protein